MRQTISSVFCALVFLLLAGCNSAQLRVTVDNHSSAALRNVEVNYVSASFGVPYLAPAAGYHKYVEPLRSGKLQVKYVDEAGKEHVSIGPAIDSKQSMAVTCEVRDHGVQWILK